MLLIFGIRTRSSRAGGGQFFCPHCGGDRAYSQMMARRWFTLFFLPVLPLKKVGEFVRCDTCKSSYDPQVLSLPTSEHMAGLLGTAARELAVWLLRNEGVDAVEGRGVAVSFVSGMGDPYDDGRLTDDLACLPLDDTEAHLRELSSVLDEAGKERFLAGAVTVARRGDQLSDPARQLVEKAGAALGMTPAHTAGVIMTALAAEPR